MYRIFTDFFSKPSGSIPKFLLIMKLTTILLIVTFVQVSAAGFAQKITYVNKNASLKQVFAEIYKQTGYSILWTTQNVKSDQMINANFKDTSLEEVLERCLANQPLVFTIRDKMIVIRQKDEQKKIEEPTIHSPLREVIGQVTDGTSPLVGATIVIKRTRAGASTDGRGFFTLSGILETDTLLISSLGYEKQEAPVKGKSYMVILLKAATNKLDEVQVLAYGQSTTRRLSTGSSVRITSEDIASQPVTNVLQALEGRVTGLTINQANGLAGGDVTFEIRGKNSLNTNAYTSAPLVVIDGVPYPNAPINSPDISGSTHNISQPLGYGNPLYNINPSDIESVEILKDADATAIYGSRAASGVMLITTKKGKQGKTKIDINANTGVAIDTRRVDLLTTPEYRALRKDFYDKNK
jgi:TonB-dependent SusC/RagA subfamily outer membrane receptor